MTGRARRRGKDKYRWRRRMLKLAILLVFLVVGLYNLLTGSWFITKVAFPLLSDRIGYNLAADEVDMSLLRGHLRVINFRFGPGWDPIVNAPRIDCDFSLRALWNGKIKLANVDVESPDVAVSRNQAGFYNVNKVHRTPRRPDPPGPVVFPPEPAFYLSAENIKIRNGSFRLDYINRHGDSDISLYVREVDIDADRFENGGLTDFTLNLRGRLSTYSLDMSDFKMRLSCHAGFTEHLLPRLAQAETTIFDITGNAGGVDLSRRTIRATGEASGNNVLNALTVKFINTEIARLDNTASTRISVAGYLDFYPWHMTAKADATPVDPEMFDYFHNYLGVPLRGTAMNTSNTFTLDYENAGLEGTTSLLSDPASAAFEYGAKWRLADNQLICDHFASTISGTGSAGLELKNQFAVEFGDESPKLLSTPTIRLTADRLALDRCLRCFGVEPGWNPGTLNAGFTCAFAPDLSAFSLSGSGTLDGLQPANLSPLSAKFDLTGSLALNGMLKVGSFHSSINIGTPGPARMNISDAVLDLAGGDSHLTVQAESLDPSLFDLKPDMTAILRELGNPLMRFGGKFVYSPKRGTLEFSGVEAALTGEAAPHPMIKVDDNTCFVDRIVFAKPLHASLSLPEYTVPDRLDLPFGTIQGGKWSFTGGLNASANMESIRIEGRTYAKGTAMRIAGFDFPEMNICAPAWMDFENGELSFNLKQLQVVMNSREALDLTMSLRRLAKGGMHVSGEVSNCTEDMLAPFGLKLRSQLEASGDFDLDFRSPGKFIYKGGFIAGTTISGQQKDHQVKIVGSLHLNADESGLKLSDTYLDFTTAKEMLGNLKIDGFLPVAGTPDRAFHLLVQSDRLDAENIFSLVDDTRDRKIEPVISSGHIPVIADVDFNDIIWGNNMRAKLTGRLSAVNHDMSFERVFLRLNGAEMRLNGKLSGSERRTGYHFEATSDDAEAAALLAPFLPAMHQFSANVRHARLYISGDSLSKTGFWDTMNGKLDMELENVRLSHSLGDTLPGRVMLLPFSIVANLPEILPTSRTRIERLAEVVPVFTRFYENTGAVEFEKGHVALSAAGKGRINIDDFVLTGSPVERFSFTGSLGFGSDRALKLESLVKLSAGLLIPVNIGGTLDEPEVDYTAIATGVVSANTWGRFSGL
ncbi:MAG: hypothetical protein AB7F40_04715 [Victivallaceae bacterium]